MGIVQNVLVRHRESKVKQADTIGNPVSLLAEFEASLDKYAKMEPLISDTKKARTILTDTSSLPEDSLWAEKVWRDNRFNFLYQATTGFKSMQRSGRLLFQALLQQYEMPPKVRKAVELAARFYAKSRVNAPKRYQEVEAYEKGLEAFRAHLKAAKDALAQGKLHGSDEDSSTKIKAGPFTMVNTGGFSKEIMEEAAQVAEKAATLLAKKGLSKVCYGEILVSNRIAGANTLAYYLLGSDEMFIRAKAKGGDALQTTLHELAHRLGHKFMQGKQQEINQIYRRLSSSERDRARMLLEEASLRPKPGETMVYKGLTFTFVKVVYDTIHWSHRDEETGKDIRITQPLINWITVRGTDWAIPSNFVTKYAMKDEDENFAEMVSYYCLDRLPEAQVKMLEEIL